MLAGGAAGCFPGYGHCFPSTVLVHATNGDMGVDQTTITITPHNTHEYIYIYIYMYSDTFYPTYYIICHTSYTIYDLGG